MSLHQPPWHRRDQSQGRDPGGGRRPARDEEGSKIPASPGDLYRLGARPLPDPWHGAGEGTLGAVTVRL
jgi:hypothetical protein